MPENLNEGNQTPQGEQSANSDTSAGSGQLSQEKFDALMARILTLESQSKALQSGKDKRWNEVMPVIEQVAEVLGIDKGKVQEAQEKAVMRQIVAERISQSATPPEGTGTTEPKESAVELTALVSEYGLDANDPAVSAFLTQNAGKFTSAEKAEIAVARMMKQKASNPTLTSEQTVVSTGGKPETKLSDQVREQKSAELKNLYRNYTENADRIKVLENELNN